MVASNSTSGNVFPVTCGCGTVAIGTLFMSCLCTGFLPERIDSNTTVSFNIVWLAVSCDFAAALAAVGGSEGVKIGAFGNNLSLASKYCGGV